MESTTLTGLFALARTIKKLCTLEEVSAEIIVRKTNGELHYRELASHCTTDTALSSADEIEFKNSSKVL
jgi:hypothetical protein